MWLLWVFGELLVFGGALVLWGCGGVSIMREWEKDKANPLKKHKKNLTRELKKSYTKGNRGSEKFYEEIKKYIFISIGKFKFEWMWGK